MPSKLDKENLNIEKQLRLLESLDSRICDDAKQSLRMHVEHGKGISNLVNYFCSTRSERALEILYRVNDPYHNILLDDLKNLMKNQKLPEVLALLGQLIQKQPSWVNQVIKHNLFKHIIEHLRLTRPVIVRDVISGMFFMCILLPLCTDSPSNALQGCFNFFIYGCDTLSKLISLEKEERNPNVSGDKSLKDKIISNYAEPEHCGLALREYFQALYGIYPIQFTCFLKAYFAEKPERKKQPITPIILSLMNGVRLHPYLIFQTKEWEQSSQRYEDKTDAAFFLDQIRQITIGAIPVPVNFENEDDSEPASPSYDGQSSRGQTYTFPAVDNESSVSGAWMNESTDLLDLINTPENSRPSSPMIETPVESPVAPSSEGKIRRPSGEPRSSRLSSFGNSINTMLKRSERKSVVEHSTIEIEMGDEQGRRDSQGSDNLCDEAEDALDDLPTLEIKEIAERRKYYEIGPSTSQTSPPPPPPQSEVTSPTNEVSRAPTISEIAEKAKSQASSLMEAAKAARIAVQERKQLAIEIESELPSASIRSRSASLKPLPGNRIVERGRTSTIDAGLLQSPKESDSSEIAAPESINSDNRSRFSVTSYFTKLNRQRFVSECPQRVDLSIADEIPLVGRARTLERTFSCPDLERQPSSTSDQMPKQSDIQKKKFPGKEFTKDKPFYDRYPHLKKFQPLDLSYLHQLEERFAVRQDKKLDLYMTASKSYHNCLKSLGLADKLPGRIYDDLSHITEGISMEKQRDILCARLQLVNQHLMYERSCRLLHALRNRRLFVQIMGENNLKAQLQTERQQNFMMREEVESLRDGLTSKRREMIDMVKRQERREIEITKENRRILSEAFKTVTTQNELIEENMQLKRACADNGLKLERVMRKLDDLTETLKRKNYEIDVYQDKMEELKRAHEENQSLKESLLITEKYNERLRSPEMEDKQKLGLYSELDRVTKEREHERLLKEELREKNNDLEHAVRAEHARAEKFCSDLSRSARILREQNEAADQKFLSLQMVNEQNLQLINDLRVELETALDAEAAFRAATKTHDPGEIPPEPLPSLFGTTTNEPTISFMEPNRNVGEQSIFQFDEDSNMNIEL